MARSGLSRWLLEPEAPGLGLDLRSTDISVVRVAERRGRREIDLCLSAPLPQGVLSFSMLSPNLSDGETLFQLLGNVLSQAGVKDTRLALSLPDHLARIPVQQVPDAPRSESELLELLRFRLKNPLPFDAAEARIAYARLPGTTPTFLTGVMRQQVVSEYEDLLGGLGFQVGLVLTASMSVLNLLNLLVRRDIPAGGDYFFLNLEEEYFTLTLVRDGEGVVLARTLGMKSSEEGGAHYQADELMLEIIPTLIFYREKLKGSALSRIYYRSLRPDLQNLQPLLQDQFEAPAEPFELLKAIDVGKDLQIDLALAEAVGAAAGAALGHAA